jgi:Domain of unknown function (DUF4159)
MTLGTLRRKVRKWLPYTGALLLLLSMSGALLAFQRIRLQDFQREADSQYADAASEKTEWAFARLRYNGLSGGAGGFGGFRRRGGSRWTTDYPKADRQFVQGVRRLTRLDARPIEQVVDPDTDELFDWPWIYAVEVGSWDFTPDQAERMRQFLLKGGFLMVDDFHGTFEWQRFLAGLHKIFPDRPVEDLTDQDEIFHVINDLDQRIQVPGIQYLRSGRTYEQDGVNAAWRAVRDDQGRIVVAICHNMDLGDAWEWADAPQYPEKFTSLAYRVGINYIVYGMTH